MSIKKEFIINGDKAVCEMLGAVAERKDLDFVESQAVEICHKYFPNADEVMFNTFKDFAHFAQHYVLHKETVFAVVRRYALAERGKRDGCPLSLSAKRVAQGARQQRREGVGVQGG
ncbi:hypothetical protein FACS1894211_14230 [Clostridia bacterium]|nr:hypothetical protein FACS1894211_14230 [Clostridia bacterium]